MSNHEKPISDGLMPCDAVMPPGWICTLKAGHAGWHHAKGPDGRTLKSWGEGDPAASPRRTLPSTAPLFFFFGMLAGAILAGLCGWLTR